MEVIVTSVRLVYHDAASIGLELEVADAVKFYVTLGNILFIKMARTSPV